MTPLSHKKDRGISKSGFVLKDRSVTLNFVHRTAKVLGNDINKLVTLYCVLAKSSSHV